MAIDFGNIEYNGVTITLTEQAYASNYGTDGDVRYYAAGVDDKDNKYQVSWELTPEWQEQQERHRTERHGDTYDGVECDCNDDESTACNWDAPSAVVREAYVQKFETINTIKKANFDAGGHWFGKAEMSFFNTSVYPRLIQCSDGKVLFVTSEQYGYENQRAFSVRIFDPSDASIDTVGEFQGHKTRDEAYKAAKQFAAKAGE